ncbi:MAG: hypothetical protein ACYDA6_00060 [Solirubrobacteraceae bacterium]
MRWFARGTNLLRQAATMAASLLAVLVVDTVQSRDTEARHAAQATKTAGEAVAELRALAAADGAKIDALRAQIAALGAIPVSQPAVAPSPTASGSAPRAATPTTRPAQPPPAHPAANAPQTPPTSAPPPAPTTTTTTQPAPPPKPCATIPLVGCVP